MYIWLQIGITMLLSGDLHVCGTHMTKLFMFKLPLSCVLSVCSCILSPFWYIESFLRSEKRIFHFIKRQIPNLYPEGPFYIFPPYIFCISQQRKSIQYFLI